MNILTLEGRVGNYEEVKDEIIDWILLVKLITPKPTQPERPSGGWALPMLSTTIDDVSGSRKMLASVAARLSRVIGSSPCLWYLERVHSA